MRTTWTFHSAQSLIFGRNAVERLGEVVQRCRVRRVLIVTDTHLIQAGVLNRVRLPLERAGTVLHVFADGRAEPSLQLAQTVVRDASGFAADAVLGLGGGSNLDVAKLTALLLAHGGEPRDYVGDDRVPGPTLPVIAVPTTAGTGSEVSCAAAFTDSEQQVKVGMLSNYLRPMAAIVDPLLTMTCPAKVTADSGIDALTHAIEAYTAIDNEVFPLPPNEVSCYQGRHPLGDLLAEKAIALCGQHLIPAVRDGSNETAREGMALAATLAGLAFSNVGVALVHAMEYPVGAVTHCSHGEGNGLLLPFVMRYNLPARTDRLARVAELLGEAAEAEQAIAAVEALKSAIGIPARLRDLGVREEQLPGFAAKAASIQRIVRVNPRQATVANIEAIYREAL